MPNDIGKIALEPTQRRVWCRRAALKSRLGLLANLTKIRYQSTYGQTGIAWSRCVDLAAETQTSMLSAYCLPWLLDF